jgi:hypothetical protein
VLGPSFAWFCRELGYPSKVILSADLPEGRIQAVRQYGADVISSPGGEYIRVALKMLVQILKEDRQRAGRTSNRLHCVNHADDLSVDRRKPREIRELVIEIAKTTGFGYTRIVGELRKIGIRKISRDERVGHGLCEPRLTPAILAVNSTSPSEAMRREAAGIE